MCYTSTNRFHRSTKNDFWRKLSSPWQAQLAFQRPRPHLLRNDLRPTGSRNSCRWSVTKPCFCQFGFGNDSVGDAKELMEVKLIYYDSKQRKTWYNDQTKISMDYYRIYLHVYIVREQRSNYICMFASKNGQRFCTQSMAQSDILIQRSKDHLQHRQASPKQPCRSKKQTILLIKHNYRATLLHSYRHARTAARPHWHTRCTSGTTLTCIACTNRESAFPHSDTGTAHTDCRKNGVRLTSLWLVARRNCFENRIRNLERKALNDDVSLWAQTACFLHVPA